MLINTKNRIIIDQDYESEQKEDRKQVTLGCVISIAVSLLNFL